MFKWNETLIRALLLAVVGLLPIACENAQQEQVTKNDPITTFLVTESHKKTIKERPIDTCLFQILQAGSKVVKIDLPKYYCLDVVYPDPNFKVDSVEVFYWANCRANSAIDSLIVYFKDKKQVISLEYGRVYYFSFENSRKYLRFVHCNNDEYYDLAIQSCRSGNGCLRTEVLIYNVRKNKYEYDQLLSEECYLCYDRGNNIYQTYARGGQSDYLFSRFRMDNGDRVFVEEMDVRPDWNRSNRDQTYIITKHSAGGGEVIDTLCFIHSDLFPDGEVHDSVWRLPILKQFHDFDEKFRI